MSFDETRPYLEPASSGAGVRPWYETAARPKGVDEPPPATVPRPQGAAVQPSGFSQTLLMLVTILCLLGAARYFVPSIVEQTRYAWCRGELRARYEAGGDGLQNVSLGALSQAYQMVTQHVGPSVVHIDVSRRTGASPARIANLLGDSPDEGFSTPPVADQGSGVVIDDDGHVMTNYHVIAEGERITVGLSDGRRLPAQVVGTDTLTDLALLKVDANSLFPIKWGDSDRSEVGSPVWAVGSPFGLDQTVTFGILSGKHRMVKASSRYQDFMQSDAAVNPGNSGGPLVDARGELIGINTAIVGDTFRGVSFAIPSNVVRKVYERLRDHGRFDRGWLGVALEEVPEELLVGDDRRIRGALVSGLAGEQSPAARAGLQAGDLIVKLDQYAIKDVGHLMRLVGNLAAGSSVVLQVQRDDEPLTLEVVIGNRPENLSTR